MTRTNDEARHSLDELLAEGRHRLLHRAGHRRHTGLIGAKQFAAMRDGVVFPQHRQGAAARHRRVGRGAAQRQGVRRGSGSLRRGMATDRSPVGCDAQCGAHCPTSAGATWNTEARQAQMVADDLEALLAGKDARPYRQPGGVRTMYIREIRGPTRRPRCWQRPRTCCAAGGRGNGGQHLGPARGRQPRHHPVVGRLLRHDARRLGGGRSGRRRAARQPRADHHRRR